MRLAAARRCRSVRARLRAGPRQDDVRDEARSRDRPGGVPEPRAAPLGRHRRVGQVQNQAVGYAFPIGPFFALGHAAGLHPTGSCSGSGRHAARRRDVGDGPPGRSARDRARTRLDRRRHRLRALAELHRTDRLHLRGGTARRAHALEPWCRRRAGAAGGSPRRAAARSASRSCSWARQRDVLPHGAHVPRPLP